MVTSEAKQRSSEIFARLCRVGEIRMAEGGIGRVLIKVAVPQTMYIDLLLSYEDCGISGANPSQ